MTMDFQSRSAISVDLPGSYIDGSGNHVTRNLGTLGSTVQLGDGVTAITFPAQIAPHGMAFDGANDYLLRAEASDELTFTDPAPFSIELLITRLPLQIGSFAFYVCKSGGGAGFSSPYMLFLQNAGGAMMVSWASMNSGAGLRGIVTAVIGDYWPPGIITHVVGAYDESTWRLYFNAVQAFTAVAAGCYAPDAVASPLYTMAGRYGPGVLHSWAGGQLYNNVVYPFALQPGEVAQLYRQRLATVDVGL